ncbi:MAG: adenylyl-sulfate kinase [Nitrospira sp. LK70]|nr:adenylyl-sulfate kinase [Nitrospira sp. LK70]
MDDLSHCKPGSEQFACLMKREDLRMSGKPVRHIRPASLTSPSVSTSVIRHPATVTRASRGAKRHGSAIVENGDFLDVCCDAQIEVCEARDVKGMYKKARRPDCRIRVDLVALRNSRATRPHRGSRLIETR